MSDEVGHGSPPGSGYVKVVYALDRDEDGWPPASAEGLWAVPVSDDVVRIENSPWFVRGVANGDLIRVRRGDDGQTWADERVAWSGWYTIRIIPFREGPLHGSLQGVLDQFLPLGVTGEGMGIMPIVALDVPPTADLAAVKRRLVEGQRNGSWDYEEGCVDDTWIDIHIE